MTTKSTTTASELPPVIVHSSFEGSEVRRLLGKFYKVRVAQGTEPHSIIFPKTSDAFLIHPLCELVNTWPPREKEFMDKNALQSVQKFIRIHRNAFVFLTAGELTADELMVFSEIQDIFESENVTFYPACSAAQCIGIINDIVQPKLTCDDISQIRSFVEGDIDEDMIANMLEKNIGITSHDSMVLLDGCQNLSNISSASMDQLLECSLSVQTANLVQKFFQ